MYACNLSIQFIAVCKHIKSTAPYVLWANNHRCYLQRHELGMQKNQTHILNPHLSKEPVSGKQARSKAGQLTY